MIPQTPAEKQAVLTDAADAMVDGDADHNRRVLREAYAVLAQDAPRLWKQIKLCRGCGGGYAGCVRCWADRAEYAALIGM